MKNIVYILWWDNNSPSEDDYDREVVGVFSSEEKALEEKKKLESKMNLSYNSFWISDFELDDIQTNFKLI